MLLTRLLSLHLVGTWVNGFSNKSLASLIVAYDKHVQQYSTTLLSLHLVYHFAFSSSGVPFCFGSTMWQAVVSGCATLGFFLLNSAGNALGDRAILLS